LTHPQDFDYATNAPFAVRNERYKLIHFFNASAYSSWCVAVTRFAVRLRV